MGVNPEGTLTTRERRVLPFSIARLEVSSKADVASMLRKCFVRFAAMRL
ncbi:MAG: hypothetical protein JWM55_1001 [Acidimicrobiaceae bacterium]|nr:hypothetical protein [Acidimicrobiaceae bacterium]